MTERLTVKISSQRRAFKLKQPLHFGRLVIAERSYCVVHVTLSNGVRGWSFSLDRSAPVSDLVDGVVAPLYESAFAGDPADAWDVCLGSLHPAVAAGAGLRALSLVDLAVYDALARSAGSSVASYVGIPQAKPAIFGIVGYPPSLDAPAVEKEVQSAVRAGVGGVKLPIATNSEATRQRTNAAIRASEGLPVALDLAWAARSADEAARLVDGLDLAWVEDPFPPGNIRELVKLRRLLDVPLASGDEESHLYHPEVLLDAGAVDIVRLDATCQGGATRMLRLASILKEGRVPVSWHMNTSVHLQLSGAGDMNTVSVEISAPGSGVDLFAETLVADSRRLLHDGMGSGTVGWGLEHEANEDHEVSGGWSVL
jgi:L-alanine-DL-glutamate epimerase-like enolase superfamily enzyme